MTIVELDERLQTRLAAVADALGQPTTWAIEQAVTDFVEVQESHIAAIEEGLRDAEAGRTVDHDKVAAWLRSWGTENPLPRPRCD